MAAGPQVRPFARYSEPDEGGELAFEYTDFMQITRGYSEADCVQVELGDEDK